MPHSWSRIEQDLFKLTLACFEQPKSNGIHRGRRYVTCFIREFFGHYTGASPMQTDMEQRRVVLLRERDSKGDYNVTFT